MSIIPVNISLSERDLYLYDIEDQIKARRELILNKKQMLDKKQKVNHFLAGVKNDYQKYYQYIVNEKQQQYNSMKVLQNYLDDLIKTDKFTNNEIHNVKHDQTELLTEMDKIKSELEKLIRQTN
jgi:hypothetical protein